MRRWPIVLAATLLSFADARTQTPSRTALDVFFIDVEGGQATLFVTPAGESMLVDAGWAGFEGRDAGRIEAAAKQAITAYAMEQLRQVPGLTIYGPDVAQRGGVISFTLADIHPHDLASILDQEVGVAVRAGHHCAQPLMERLGLAATARASFYVYTIPEDIDVLVQGLHKALEIFNL